MSLKQDYKNQVISKMKEFFGYKNNLAVPKLEKVVVSVGMGQYLRDAKFNEVVENTLKRITGQRPVITLAKKSISNFKIRKGMMVGMKVTLRGNKMYDFVDKLINVTLPRVRDFRGLELNSVDGQGNLTVGFKENLAFPEIKSDEIEKIHGLEVTIVTATKNRTEGLKLLEFLGFPFKKK